MASALVLGVTHFYRQGQDFAQTLALNAKIHTLRVNNLKLQKQFMTLKKLEISAGSGHNHSAVGGGTASKSSHGITGTSNSQAQLVSVIIDPGMTINSIANRLAAKGIIANPGKFVVAAINYNQPLRAGKFELRPDEPYSQILYLLATN